MKKKQSPLKRAMDVLDEGDRKGGYIGEFNTLGKCKKRSRQAEDEERRRRRR